MADPWRYDGRRVVVTGCSSGMGEATAAELRSLGASVVGLDLKPPCIDLDQFVCVDLADPAAIDSAIGSIDGAIDGLFNCAGISEGSGRPPLDVYTVNFLGTRHLTEALIPRIPRGGAIATISSLGGLGWERKMPVIRDVLAIDSLDEARAWAEQHPEEFTRGGYGFSKQCLIVYAMQRCIDLAARGIRINTICPSPVETPMLADSRRARGDAYIDGLPQPLGRVSSASEQARVLVFLNSGAASYITGQTIWTDGGYTAGVTTGQIEGRV